MNVITPKPSQAAVVLKRFLAENGIELKLSKAQEATARMHGYKDWQALIAGQAAHAAATPSGKGTDYPTAIALQSLLADVLPKTPGAKQLLFITDGVPDPFRQTVMLAPAFVSAYAPLSATSTSRMHLVTIAEMLLRLANCTDVLSPVGRKRIIVNTDALLSMVSALLTVPASFNISGDIVCFHLADDPLVKVTVAELLHTDSASRFLDDTNIAVRCNSSGRAFVIEGDREREPSDKADSYVPLFFGAGQANMQSFGSMGADGVITPLFVTEDFAQRLASGSQTWSARIGGHLTSLERRKDLTFVKLD